MAMPNVLRDGIEAKWTEVKNLVFLGVIANHLRQGEHLSRATGSGIEFDKLGEYEGGDKIAHVDWMASLSQASSPEDSDMALLVKRFVEAREVPTILVLDLSRSMFFGGGLEAACSILELAGICAFSANYVGDSVGFIGFSADVDFSAAPRKGTNFIFACLEALWDIVEKNAAAPGGSKTNINGAIELAVSRFRTRSLMFIFSDFLGIEPEINWELVDALSNKHDVIALIASSGFEEELPCPRRGFLKVKDLETGFSARVRMNDFSRMVSELKDRRGRIAKSFEETGCSSVILRRDGDGFRLDALVEKFLERRIR